MENHTKSITGSSLAGTLATWARQGMESFVATQKILLDLTAQQNSLALGFVRERVNFSPLRPLTAMVNLVGQGIANFVAAQKILLDLAAEENALVLQGVRDGMSLTGTPAAITDAVGEAVTTFVGMQKKYLTIVEEQSQAVVVAIQEGKPYEGKKLGEIAREGLENFVHTQKRFLDLVTDVTRAEADGKGRKVLKASERKQLVALAKDGMDKLVESQKKLLDVAARQIDGGVTTFQDMVRPSPEPSTTVGEFMRRGVENVINAQKSLLDVAMKPFLPPPPHTPAHARAGRRK